MAGDELPLSVCFPDAAAIFTSRHKNLDDIKADCLVALDTNVLLAPYSLSDKDIEQIKNVYEKLSKAGRLVIPAQVAREFARNRSNKLADLVKTLQDQISRMGNPISTKYSFLKLVPDYANALNLSEEIEAKEKELARTLRKVLDVVRSWNSSDPIWDMYRAHFKSSVVDLCEVAQKAIPEELKYRNLHNIPPGYKDEKKSDEGSGDLIIWKTILQEARERKADFIFVTMDQKPDWWTQSANAPLYPRFELLEEFRANTDGKSVILMRFSEFLENFGAEVTVVREVKRVEDQEATASDPEEDFTRMRSAAPFRLKMSDLQELRHIERSIEKTIIRTQARLIRAVDENGDRDSIAAYRRELNALKIRLMGVRRRITALRERS